MYVTHKSWDRFKGELVPEEGFRHVKCQKPLCLKYFWRIVWDDGPNQNLDHGKELQIGEFYCIHCGDNPPEIEKGKLISPSEYFNLTLD